MSLLLSATVAPAIGLAAFDFDDIEDLTPGEQYRQLSLLMLVSGGIDPALLRVLQPIVDSNPGVMKPGRSNLELDDFVTPLVLVAAKQAA